MGAEVEKLAALRNASAVFTNLPLMLIHILCFEILLSAFVIFYSLFPSSWQQSHYQDDWVRSVNTYI